MHTLMYVTDDRKSAENMAVRLGQPEAGVKSCHILSKDKTDTTPHHLRQVSILQESELYYAGMRGAVYGAASGLLLTLLIGLAKPAGVVVLWWLLPLAGGFLGFSVAWVAGMLRLARESEKLRPLHSAIHAGKYLMLIGTDSDARARHIRQAVRRFYPEARFAADEPAGISLFQNDPEFHIEKRY